MLLPRRAWAGGPGARWKESEFLADSPMLSNGAWGGEQEGIRVGRVHRGPRGSKTLGEGLRGVGDPGVQD